MKGYEGVMSMKRIGKASAWFFSLIAVVSAVYALIYSFMFVKANDSGMVEWMFACLLSAGAVFLLAGIIDILQEG